MTTGSNSNRRSHTQSILERKVEVLREFVREGLPKDYLFPTSINKLRTWSDPSRGVEVIGSPQTTNPRLAPHNIHLVDEANELIDALKRQKRTPRRQTPPLISQIQALRDEMKIDKALVGRLTSQLNEALHSLDISRRELRSEVERRKRLTSLNDELRVRLASNSYDGPKLV